ncbi:MAG TPA: transketolase C-terminal domain-containing protein [Candidatus Paceibacterota bacterium]|nr:transketolase C-terminal domain-containing protein [Candidatus Paceibacterota bacterium]
MLNDEAKLNHNIFSKHIEEEPTRDGYGKGLLEAGKEENIVVLTADLEDSTRCQWFAKVYPQRFVECGVAEQNMVGMSAGLALSGKIPFINSYANFCPGRTWEQIRTVICYNNANVKIAGHHAGISVGPDGATHQATEDIALMRALPNMKVVVPCDGIEAQKATLSIANIFGPTYIRLQREKTPIMTTKETPFVFGKSYVLWQSKKKNLDVLVVGVGPILTNALLAAKDLEKDGIGVVVLNSHTIKPLDGKEILKWAKKIGAVVTVEEHNIIGGLGGAVSEFLSESYPVPIERVGIRDVFGESGKPEELIKKYHLDKKDIESAVRRVIKMKS